MDSDFREKAKRVLRKLNERFHHGGGALEWTDEERETWRQINALDPGDRFDLAHEAFESQVEDQIREINLRTEEFRKAVRQIRNGSSRGDGSFGLLREWRT